MKIEKVTIYCDVHGGPIKNGDRNVLRVTTPMGGTFFTMDLCGECAGRKAEEADALKARLQKDLSDA